MKVTNNFENLEFELSMIKNTNSLRDRVNSYFKWNLSVFPIQKHRKILDLGSGMGLYFNAIMEYFPSLYVATDYSSTNINQIKSLFKGKNNCEAIEIDLMNPEISTILKEYRFDYIFIFDVLEHLKDDKQALKNIYNIMKISQVTALFLRVPALQFLYGRNDSSIGHYRRYDLKSLKKLLESSCLNVELICYQNFLGIVPWYIIGKILKRSLSVSNTEGKFFNCLVPIIKVIEKFIKIPFGLSLYCVCTIKK